MCDTIFSIKSSLEDYRFYFINGLYSLELDTDVGVLEANIYIERRFGCEDKIAYIEIISDHELEDEQIEDIEDILDLDYIYDNTTIIH